MAPHAIAAGILATVILLLGKTIFDYFTSPLRCFDGPVLARFTNWWRMIDVWNRHCEITHQQLHKKYGTAVRMGPRLVSLSDPKLIKVVYNSKSPWKKSDMYRPNDVIVQGVRISNVFGLRDETRHAALLRPIRHMYSMTRVRDFEPLLKPVITRFMDALERNFMQGSNAGKAFDVCQWMNYMAWDAMSELTFSKSFGFIEQGKDVGGFLHTAEQTLDYYAPISQVPELDHLLAKNPVYRIGPPAFTWAMEFAIGAVSERHELEAAGRKVEHSDFLDLFLGARSTHPDVVNDNQVINYLLHNLLAGSDSTALTLGAAVYYILRHPVVHEKLTKELTSRELSTPVTWTEILELPYLRATMREVMRIHPGVGMMLERTVPEGGMALPDGRYIPQGYIVGMNSWVINRNEEFFGEDPDKFVPERWLQRDDETAEEFGERERRMKEADMTFGYGPRVCIGRNISQLESFKTIGTLFKNYDIALADPKKEWGTKNSFFVLNWGVDITMKKKDGAVA